MSDRTIRGELTESGWALVDVVVRGPKGLSSKTKALLDTGAGATHVDSERAAELDASSAGELPASSPLAVGKASILQGIRIVLPNGGEIDSAKAKVLSAALGSMPFRVILGVEAFRGTRLRYDGVARTFEWEFGE